MTQVIPTGEEGGAGNLIICEVVLAHFQDHILGADGKIDPFKLDAVARMGGDWYCRAQGDALFELPKPNRIPGMGIDQLPEAIRHSTVLTGNELARLGNMNQIPTEAEITEFAQSAFAQNLYSQSSSEQFERQKHEQASSLLQENRISEAWKTLLLPRKG